MILNRKKLAGYWHIMSYHDIQDMPKTACIQWNIWSVIWAHCLSLWCARLSKFPTFFTFHRYGYVSSKHIQTPYRKVNLSLIWSNSKVHQRQKTYTYSVYKLYKLHEFPDISCRILVIKVAVCSPSCICRWQGPIRAVAELRTMKTGRT